MIEINSNIKQQLTVITNQPGCYFFYNHKNQIIYIGKAKNLAKRISNYFQKSHNYRISRMMQEATHLECISTTNEKAALILEHNLIKKHRPKYNIVLKDNKRYPYIVITKEPDPVYSYVRKLPASYLFAYGPLPDGTKALKIMQILQMMLPLRRCKGGIGKPCFHYHLQQCSGACFKTVPGSYYQTQLKQIKRFFRNQNQFVQKHLVQRMNIAAKNLQFEEANRLKVIITKIKLALLTQNVQLPQMTDTDVINYYWQQDTLVVVIWFYRGGMLINQQNQIIYNVQELNNAIWLVLQDWYSSNILPNRVLVPTLELAQWGRLVFNQEFSLPANNLDGELLAIVKTNSQQIWAQQINNPPQLAVFNKQILCEQLAQMLGYDDPIYEINIFDISNWQHDVNIGGCLVYKNGYLNPPDNRIFNLTFGQQNDFLSMQQAVYQKYHPTPHQLKSYPDLIIVDGGKIQIKAAQIALQQLGITIPVAGLVKNKLHQTESLMTGDYQIINLDHDTILFRWLSQIQTEVHNFVVRRLHNKKNKNMKFNVLSVVPGVGPIITTKLYQAFASLPAMAQAPTQQLNQIIKNQTTTKNLQNWLLNYLHNNNS